MPLWEGSQCILYENFGNPVSPQPPRWASCLPKTSYSTARSWYGRSTGREVIAAIFAQSSATRGSGTYTAEFKLDERTTFLRWVGTMDGHKFESFLNPKDYDGWLGRESQRPRTDLLRPYDATKMIAAPCNPKVGNVKNNGPEMLNSA
jgi:hypothetical protein